MTDLKIMWWLYKTEVHTSEWGVPSIILTVINDQINQFRTLEWIYSIMINDSLQVTSDVKEQRRIQLYSCDSHV